MKNIFYLIFSTLCVLLIFTQSTNAQQYGIGPKIDEFTSDTTITSEWVKLNDPVWKSGRIAYFRITIINNQMMLQFKTTTGNSFAIVEKGDILYIKLENDQILEFTSISREITSLGGGAINLRGSKTEGVFLHFLITEDQLIDLSKNNIYKVRLNTQQGYLEIIPEKKKYKAVLRDYFVTYLTYLQQH